MNASLRGIFVPHVTPVDARGRINESELRRYLDWLIAKGVDGLYPNGSTGEFLRFTADQRRSIVRIACDVAAGRVPVLAGAAEANVLETLRACEAYAGDGARAVAIVSPFYYRLRADAVIAYFSEIARQSPIDVTLYNIPMFATPLDVDTVRRLAEFPRIIGIKDSSGDVAFMLRLLAAIRPHRPDFSFLTGWDPILLPLLAMGVDGGTHATAGVAPELTAQILKLFRQGEFHRARTLQDLLLALFDAMLSAGDFPAGFRAGVALRGFDAERSPQPGIGASENEKRSIADHLNAALGALNVQ